MARQSHLKGKPGRVYCTCSLKCPIPATDDTACRHWQSTPDMCKCPDYFDPKRPHHPPTWIDVLTGENICKHQHAERVKARKAKAPAADPAWAESFFAAEERAHQTCAAFSGNVASLEPPKPAPVVPALLCSSPVALLFDALKSQLKHGAPLRRLG